MAEYVRGVRAVFTANFLEYDGTPMQPADPESWPAVTIRDPEGTSIATGVATRLAPGEYQFGWFVPVAAELSTTDGNDWRIDWSLVTAAGHTKQQTQTFQVVDRIESTPDERSYTYLTNDGGTVRALLRWPRQLCEVTLTIKDEVGTAERLVVQGVATNDQEADSCNPNRRIIEAQQDGEYLYYYDVQNLTAGEYQFHWNTLETEKSERRVEVQIARAAPDRFWHYNVEVRTLIDKLQKAADTIQAYSDADVFSYVKGGLDILNFLAPPTNFVLADIPLVGSSGLRMALVLCSAIHAINAQQILEVELSFDHSGQTVTLNYNHDYSGVLGNLQALLDRFAEAKIHVFRRAEGAAFGGARLKNYRYTNRVFRLDQTFRGVVPPGGAALWRNLGV